MDDLDIRRIYGVKMSLERQMNEILSGWYGYLECMSDNSLVKKE